MPTLSYLPAWSVDYSYEVSPNVERTRSGISSQRGWSNNRIVIADVSRRLLGAQLPYFEWFIREVCEEGTLKFTDYYADGNGQTTGLIRIVDGAYSVSTDLRRHTIRCQIEIFR